MLDVLRKGGNHLNKDGESKFSNFAFNLTLILIGLFSVYFYQNAWGWPVVDSYPQIERLLNSDYLKNDFLTNTFDDFSPRLYVAYFYIFGSELFNTDYTIFIGYLNLLRIFLLTISVYALLKVLSENKYIALIGTFLGSVSFYSIPKMVAWFFSTPVFSAAEFSLVFIIFGLALIYKSKVSLGFLLFSIAMIFHPVLAVHGLAIGCILFITRYGFKTLQNIISIQSILGLFLVISTFLLSYIPYKNSLKSIELLTSEEFTHIIGEIRHPHHYIPSMFGAQTWLIFIMYLVTFFYMIYILRHQLANHIYKFLKYYSAFLGLVMVTGYIFVEIFPVKPIVTLIPYRSLVFFTLVYLLVFSNYLYYKFKNKDYLSFVLLHIPFIPILTADIKISTLLMLVVFSYSIISDILKKKKIRLGFFVDDYIFKRINLKYFYMIIITLAIAGSYLILERGLGFNIPDIEEPKNEVYSWVKENTPKESIILSEIKVDYLVNQKIRLLSKRAVPVSKDFPFNEKYYKEWSERFIDIYDGVYDNTGYINNLTDKELNHLSQRYQIDYILRTKELAKSEHFTLMDILQLEEKEIYIYSYEN